MGRLVGGWLEDAPRGLWRLSSPAAVKPRLGTRPFTHSPARSAMKPSTDYIRHAAKLARKLQMDAAMGTGAPPDADFYKTLAKALEEIAAGLEQVATRE
jgi:tagatose-1,6-bisphosphate aldolase non-catalytic subunit AgaZ/GatZ